MNHCQHMDADDILAIIDAPAYDVRGDLNLSGNVNTTDKTLAAANTNTGGWGVLSGADYANRKGYAGYEFDDIVAGAQSMWHVRHRVLNSDLGTSLQGRGYDFPSISTIALFASESETATVFLSLGMVQDVFGSKRELPKIRMDRLVYGGLPSDMRTAVGPPFGLPPCRPANCEVQIEANNRFVRWLDVDSTNCNSVNLDCLEERIRLIESDRDHREYWLTRCQTSETLTTRNCSCDFNASQLVELDRELNDWETWTCGGCTYIARFLRKADIYRYSGQCVLDEAIARVSRISAVQ